MFSLHGNYTKECPALMVSVWIHSAQGAASFGCDTYSGLQRWIINTDKVTHFQHIIFILFIGTRSIYRLITLTLWTSFMSFSLMSSSLTHSFYGCWSMNLSLTFVSEMWNAQEFSGLKSLSDAVLLCLILEAVDLSVCDLLWNYIPWVICKAIIKQNCLDRSH